MIPTLPLFCFIMILDTKTIFETETILKRYSIPYRSEIECQMHCWICFFLKCLWVFELKHHNIKLKKY